MKMKFAQGRGSTTSSKPYSVRVFWSYLPDWVLSIFLWGIFYLLDKIEGYRRLFDVTDTSLAHPYAVHERIPVWLLAVTCGIIPALIIIAIAAIQRSFWDAHNGILGLVLGLGLCVTFTDIIKITVGRPRPDFFDRCQLPPEVANPVHGLTSWHVCRREHLLREGFRSFPSGHSSFAWTGMTYLFLYLAAKFRIANKRGYTFKSWILLIPVSCCSLVSVSRTMDYRHHATDVIAGAIVGLLTGWWAYRQYYPAIHDVQSWRPYPPRIANEDIPLHHRRATSGTESDQVPLQDGGSLATTHTDPTYPSPSFQTTYPPGTTPARPTAGAMV